MNYYSCKDLTFVICAYKECEYLEESILSLLNQSEKANILISTSTPNGHIEGLAEKYGIKMCVNPNGGQIADYNFAMRQAETPLIMLAHQDEVLHKDFVKEIIEKINRSEDPIIVFTDYIEMHNNIVDKKQSKMIKIKKVLLGPAHSRLLMRTKFGKRMIQCLGNPITHPSVVCVRNKMPEIVFREEYKAAMDWDLWERLSKLEGSFVYVDKILLYHRMNDDNQTAVLLRTTNDRYNNEYEIFCRFWPRGIAKLIMRFYSNAYKNY
ncbi:Glycosyl transferase family 2 [Pseudobutyrivibrio sp. 49]|uniref:glycosyltransferase n=1 Tax=Pseudobutyrivibrio sp. 49 TaxID=1855344 RepID=UPI00088289B6|nr:glycosyltransferase [Pseudobutyrivibrio sp. 49]SDH60624.1 Glycosyl transferase family 2 [Pseudobutyrivibrio sp. 49]